MQRWLGHHSPAFTMARYVHLLNDDLGDPLEPATLADDHESWSRVAFAEVGSAS
jgi:hypothetical protein